MKLYELLEKAARDYRDRTAVVHLERRITFGELYKNYSGAATFLENLNLPSGERVALLWENSIEYVYLFFAIQRAGYVAVPIDTSLKPDKIAFILDDCTARGLAFHGKFKRHLSSILNESHNLEFVLSDIDLSFADDSTRKYLLGDIIEKEPDSDFPDRAVLDSLDPETAPHELMAIFYTSGSTGIPKGVMLSHRNLVSNTLATVEYLRLTSNDSVIVILPFYYIYGNSLLLTHVACGGCLVLDNRFLYPEVILDTMEKEKVTGFSGVPSNFMILLNKSSFPERELKDLRYFTQAGGAMAPEVIRRLIDAFPKKEIFIMYGQTEAAPRASYCPPEKLREKIGTIGIPVPGVELKIMDDNGDEVPDGESGEIVIIGPNVMMGYWNQPEEQDQVLRGGKLFSGDLARKDEDGYIFIIGRKKEIIKVGGNRVSAKEVEERILENEAIAEAAVYGIPDEVLGEAIRASIVLKQGFELSRKELQKFCRETLAEHKIPKQVEFLGELPKYKSGKVNKLILAEIGPKN